MSSGFVLGIEYGRVVSVGVYTAFEAIGAEMRGMVGLYILSDCTG